MSKKKRIALALLAAAACAAAIVAACLLIPFAKDLYDPAVRERFTAWIRRTGFWGYGALFVLQMLQVVVAIIPGEPFELAAGALCGGLGGTALCLAGCLAASIPVFLLSRKLGTPLLHRLFRKNQLDRFAFLHDSRKLETVTLLLFLLPGTPKDMLTYVAGTTEIPMARFLIISTFARIPSVVTSTFLAEEVLAGRWYVALLLIGVTFALGIAGILLREPVMNFCRSHRKKAEAK